METLAQSTEFVPMQVNTAHSSETKLYCTQLLNIRRGKGIRNGKKLKMCFWNICNWKEVKKLWKGTEKMEKEWRFNEIGRKWEESGNIKIIPTEKYWVTLLYQHKLLAEGETASWQIHLSIWIFSVGTSFPKEQRPALSYTHKYIALKYTELKHQEKNNYLFTCDLYGPVRNVFDACRYIARATGRGLGPGNWEFFGPCEMATSR